jgi:hypothetical protein
MRICRALIASVLLTWVACPSANAESRVALVIGNAAYTNAPALANPANDAKGVADALKNLGFAVILGVDLDKANFEKSLRAFTRELATADTGLLFYAGHGLQVGGHNYLVPVDAALAVERDLDFEAIRLDFILKQMELDRDGKTNIIFLDACRDNPLARNLARTMGTRSTAVAQGLAEVKTGVGTFIAYSTQPGNVALDGSGTNSPFAAALSQRVLEPGQPLTSIMIKVRNDVLAATRGQQVPWDHSALTGEFFFQLAALPHLDKPETPAAASQAKAMKERLEKLEDELKRKTEPSNKAAAATLNQLKQRQRQLENDNRKDMDRLFAVQREQSRETDPSKRSASHQEIGRIQIEMVRRSKDINEIKTEISALEGEVSTSAEPIPAQKKQ